MVTRNKRVLMNTASISDYQQQTGHDLRGKKKKKR